MNLLTVAATMLKSLRLPARGTTVQICGVWLWICSAIGTSCAAERAELLAHLPARIAQADRADVVTGVVKERRYVALRLNAGDESRERFEPVLLIARSTATGYVYVAHFQLESLNDLEIWFARDSLYLRQITVHHGVYSSRYQFRLRRGRFGLVGVETQSNTLATAPRTESAVALWESRSANLLTRTAVYRAQVYDPLDEDAQKRAMRRFDAGLPPTQGRERRVGLRARPDPQWDLESFNPYLFRADFLCHYFDAGLEFHDDCGTRQK